MSEEQRTAKLLIASVRCAIKNGCLHYNKAGTLLTTDAEVIKCLRDEGSIRVDQTHRVQVTTDDEELRKLN
jgi:hypothetical protein